MNEIIQRIDDIVWGPQFILIFVLLGAYLTIKLKFPQIRSITYITNIKYGKNNGINSYKALMTVLAGTLGIGNITGVASAIAIGGIGSIFWIFVSGLFAMAISYAENFLVLKYRKKDKSEGFFGGAMYVLDEVIGKKTLAILFAIFTLIATVGMGAMVQANSLCSLLNEETNLEKEVISIIISIVLAYVIFGGKYKMAKLNSYTIPFCTLTYVVLCFLIIVNNFKMVPFAINSIVKSAFGVKSVVGGAVGFSIIKCISIGFSRGMFSNEAGMGSAPIFSATTEDVEDTKTTAYVMSYSVFIDTIVLCVLTGITIVVAGTYNIPNIPIMLERTFSTLPFGSILLTFCMAIFAISTIPCWEFYGEQAIKYLFKKNYIKYAYKIVYIINIYIGCVLSLNLVWGVSNIANALMALPNIYMIYVMRSELKS